MGIKCSNTAEVKIYKFYVELYLRPRQTSMREIFIVNCFLKDAASHIFSRVINLPLLCFILIHAPMWSSKCIMCSFILRSCGSNIFVAALVSFKKMVVKSQSKIVYALTEILIETF